MATHCLDNWKQYLPSDDYNFLITYIENIRNDIPNDKMIILFGPGRNGKSTLIRNIQQYLGDEICGVQQASGDIIHNEHIKKLIVLHGLCDILRSKKKNNATINLIKYNQSFIAETVALSDIRKDVLQLSKVIKMEHVFKSTSRKSLIKTKPLFKN
jgi:ABC-type phosphate/phosphonate transport system ATPase subunit